MKNKEKTETIYYDCEEYSFEPAPETITPEQLYRLFDLSSESSDNELEGVAEMLNEPKSFTEKEQNRKKNRFFLCNIL